MEREGVGTGEAGGGRREAKGRERVARKGENA